MIFMGSRYEHGSIDVALVASGTYNVVVTPPHIDTRGVRFTVHVASEGERFDTLAQKLWNDPKKWWILADLNPEIDYPGAMLSGSLVRIQT